MTEDRPFSVEKWFPSVVPQKAQGSSALRPVGYRPVMAKTRMEAVGWWFLSNPAIILRAQSTGVPGALSSQKSPKQALVQHRTEKAERRERGSGVLELWHGE